MRYQRIPRVTTFKACYTTRMSIPGTDLDDLDERIFALLGDDGRRSYRDMAVELGVADATVRSRVARMREAGLLRITAQINPLAVRDGIFVLVGMELETRTHRVTMEEISRLPGVRSVSNVTGSYDLIVEAFLPSRQALNTFLFETLAAVEGVRSTETFVILDAIGKWTTAS